MKIIKEKSDDQLPDGSDNLSSSDKIDRFLQLTAQTDQIWTKPSSDAINRWKTIPLFFGGKGGKSGTGHIISDSWTTAPAVALRDIADGHIRRLELKAGKVVLEIVAERMADHWEFVARVQTKEKIENNYILKVGQIRLLPYSSGFYHWSSTWVPRTIRLISFKRRLVFEKVAW
jgi:hypothetical protein